MKDNIKTILIATLAVTVSMCAGFLLAMYTVTEWHSPPPSEKELALQQLVTGWCEPLPLRVLQCPTRWDACFCQPMKEGPE